jgi:hypothetical protein
MSPGSRGGRPAGDPPTSPDRRNRRRGACSRTRRTARDAAEPGMKEGVVYFQAVGGAHCDQPRQEVAHGAAQKGGDGVLTDEDLLAELRLDPLGPL